MLVYGMNLISLDNLQNYDEYYELMCCFIFMLLNYRIQISKKAYQLINLWGCL